VENNADFKLTVVANQPRFLHLFMKKLTRERVVPTPLCKSLLPDFGNCDFGFSVLPEVCQQQHPPQKIIYLPAR
jgi:hypothetical protein